MRTAPPPPLLSSHRVARLNAWARLWLVWFAGLIAAWWSAGWRGDARRLDRAARLAGAIIVINAAQRFTPPAHARHRHGGKPHTRQRAVIGSALRRALRSKDTAARLAAILSVMRDAEYHIARLLRRLHAGLTRLRVLIPARTTEAIASLAAPRVACADSS